LRIALVAFVMAALVSQGARADEIWTETRITNTSWWETRPVMWGNTIYYNDGRSGSGDIYTWDPVNGSRPLIQGPNSQITQAVHEHKLVYRDNGAGNDDLYLWDAVNGIRPIATAPGDQTNADIYGDTVVWEDYRVPGQSRVYIWDPVNGERPVSSVSSYQINPRIWGDTVVWEDGRNGRRDVYMWNPRDGERRLSTALFPMMSPAIYQDRVVMWVINDPYAPWNEPGIWEWTPQGGLRKIFEYYPTGIPQCTGLWGDLVVWSGSGPSNVAAWDPVHGKTRVNQSCLGDAMLPSLYGNTVLWQGNWDIYMCTLVPEPSGLVALLGCGGFLAVTCRRRVRKA